MPHDLAAATSMKIAIKVHLFYVDVCASTVILLCLNCETALPEIWFIRCVCGVSDASSCYSPIIIAPHWGYVRVEMEITGGNIECNFLRYFTLCPACTYIFFIASLVASICDGSEEKWHYWWITMFQVVCSYIMISLEHTSNHTSLKQQGLMMPFDVYSPIDKIRKWATKWRLTYWSL